MREIVLKAVTESIPQITAFVDGELAKLCRPGQEPAALPPSPEEGTLHEPPESRQNLRLKAQMQIDIAIDEIISNIARYAYAPGGGDVAVRFDHDESTRTVSIAFVDSGVPFDPLQKPDPDVARAVDEREVGGLGIFLVRKTMDSVEYRREGGQNILTIRKKI